MLTRVPLIEEGLNAAVYAELRMRLVTGRIGPGDELSTRRLAAELGVSQTPVRDALSRLAADGAVEIRSKRRVLVPPMTNGRFAELLRCRLLLEPEAAAIALPYITEANIARLQEIGTALKQAIKDENADSYLANNHAFHFAIYNAQPGRTLPHLIETLWLQFGPFMRILHGRIAGAVMHDHHQAALAAIRARNAETLMRAIAADITDGLGLVTQADITSIAALQANRPPSMPSAPVRLRAAT